MGISEHKTIDALLSALGEKGANNFNLYLELLDLQGHETADERHTFYGKCLVDNGLANKTPGEDQRFDLTKKGNRILKTGGWLRALLREKKEEEIQLQHKRMERIVQVCLNKQITVENLERVVQDFLNKQMTSKNEKQNWGQMNSTIALVLSTASFITSLLALIN
jgi:hypothetical protein